MLSKIWSMCLARNKEFFRDRGSLAWNFIFPFLIVGGFAAAYSGPPKPEFRVGVVSSTDHLPANGSGIFEWKYVLFVPITNKSEGIQKVERHQLDLLIELPSASSATRAYWVNSTSQKGYVLRQMLGGLKGEEWLEQKVDGGEVRYVDWLLPGIIGLNLMFSALFGVGYVIVRYRKNGVLKRLKAAPLSAFEFLAAQVLSRLFIIAFTTAVVFAGCVWILGVPVRGSWFDLGLIYLLGAFCLVSMGLVISARIRSEELAGGLLNMLTWPMMFFSGVWFSLEGLHPFVQKAAAVFPLTHVISAARAVMIDGASLASQIQHVTILAALGLFFLIIGSVLFSWD